MTLNRTVSFAAASMTLLCLGLSGRCLAGTKVTVGRPWPAGRLVSIDQIDHSRWNVLVRKYVDRDGYVDYTAWKASRADMQSLDAYLAALSRAAPNAHAGRQAKLAYWINAYNAVTVMGILREYPTESIRNHTAKLFGYNIWDDLLLTIGSKSYSLNQMEHDILRKMSEPRIHFAIVCASIGCPRLSNEAYTAEKLNAQLTADARAFFADRSKFNYDARSGRIGVSPILKWFATDFGSSTARQLATIAPYLPEKKARQLAVSGRAQVYYLNYDWNLNDQAKRGRTTRR